MVPKSLEERNTSLWSKLVPTSGNAETLEGEMLRAINRIIYRYLNDGDYWYYGYGTQTAGPAESFLRQKTPIDLHTELNNSDGAVGENYEKELVAILEKILTYIESRIQFMPNRFDMLDCEPKYEESDYSDYEG